ncbi:hypothetical protein FRB95_006372 [Tulasnella sp. JGI-2019a]|nr:hypothetical protein FRB95_006372 [Tulasnella sp. JGI-2019a]
MDDYMVQVLNIFSEGASKASRSLNDPKLMELQSSTIMMRSFNDALKTFIYALNRPRSAKARHHNALSPISRLPSDLLVEIFALAPEKGGPTQLSYGGRTEVLILATLVLVCHEWREIMHNAPSLWAHISSDDPPLANLEFLARSDQVPLHIFLDHHTPSHTARREFKTRIFQEFHRWKSVEMSDMSTELLKELEKRPAPLEEMLDIRGTMGWTTETPIIFCGNASRLRHLALRNIRIPWGSNLFSHLTTLRLAYHQDYSPSVQQVVHILQSCPDLVTFDLYLPPELNPGPIPSEALAVQLPRLERLSLSVHPLITEHLLRQMRISSCKIFCVNDVEATGPALSSAMDHLIPSLTSILLAASRVGIDITPTTLEYEAIEKVDEDDEGEGENSSKRISINATGDQFTESFALETFSWLLDNLPTLLISSPVSLNIRETDSSHAITHIIDQLSSVITNLNLGLTDAQIIVSYLAEPFQVIIGGTTELRWPLPKLTNLSFEWCDDLEPEIILDCIQRRAGRGPFWGGRGEQREELPARLTRLTLPHGSSTERLMQIFPDYMEWSGLEREDGLSDRDRDQLSESPPLRKRRTEHGFSDDDD